MTDAEMALLGLIAEQPRHGYEIEQLLEQRGMRQWTEIGFSSIYYLLRKLQDKGLIEEHVEAHAGQGPNRKVMQLTTKGCESLRIAVLDALSEPQPRSSTILVGLSNLSLLTDSEAKKALRHYQHQLLDRIGALQAQRGRQRPLPFSAEAIFEHSLALLRAEIRWADNFLDQLESEYAKNQLEKAG